jgi:hypothetical protein
MPAVNGFDNLKSGARGFILNQKERETAFLGITGDLYTYPQTVKFGRLNDITKIAGANQWPLKVTFSNRLGNTKYTRTIYNSNKPYTSDIGITGDTLEKYFYRTNSPSARDILYTAFNLRESSFNTGLVLFNQPLILSGIQRPGAKLNVFDTWKFDDGFIRGGVVTSTQRAVVDVLRLGKWFASIKGLLFITRQAGLQGSAPNTEADPLVGRRIGNGALTLISSLANTATQHLGLRFRKDGLPIAPRSTYSTVMFGNDSHGRGINPVRQTIENNRLANLKYALITVNAQNSSMPLISGLGGPQSVYGIGATNIRRVVNSAGPFPYKTATDVDVLGQNLFSRTLKYINPDSNEKYLERFAIGGRMPTLIQVNGRGRGVAGTKYNTDIPYDVYGALNQLMYIDRKIASAESITEGALQQYYTFNYEDLKRTAAASSLNSTTVKNFLLNDSGDPLNSDIANAKWISTKGSTTYGGPPSDYTKTSQHQRSKVKYPDYGIRGKDLRDPASVVGIYGKDRFGMIDPIWQINQVEVSTTDTVDDFIKLMFEDLQTNERFRFRSYIESVNEDFNPNWQEVKILGRADSPYIYQGFERSLSISFKVAALSRGDLMLMWDQLERLARTTVPSYKSNYKMVGPLIKFTLGNWFIATPAFIKSLSYTVDNETPWEINLGNTGINSQDINAVGELPMYVSVQASLQIFGEIRPEDTTEDKQLPATVRYNTGNLYPLGQTGLRKGRQNRFNSIPTPQI